MNDELKLCYVDDPWAYFTTQPISDQWGDDWDDAPYEHNAGSPYEFADHDAKKGRKPWQIVIVAYRGDFETPRSNVENSHWCVRDINAGGTAWLRSSRYLSSPPVFIHAGTSLADFIFKIKSAGGKVYLETPLNQSSTP